MIYWIMTIGFGIIAIWLLILTVLVWQWNKIIDSFVKHLFGWLEWLHKKEEK